MTLGKRIMHHRKRLGLTQEQLAEKLGVTAQASRTETKTRNQIAAQFQRLPDTGRHQHPPQYPPPSPHIGSQ